MVQATVFKGSKANIAVKDTIELPDTLTGDKVLVKITYSGLCGTGKFSIPISFYFHHQMTVADNLDRSPLRM